MMVELPFAFEVIYRNLIYRLKKNFRRQSWGRIQRSLCSLLKAICCLEILQAPYRCQQLSGMPKLANTDEGHFLLSPTF